MLTKAVTPFVGGSVKADRVLHLFARSAYARSARVVHVARCSVTMTSIDFNGRASFVVPFSSAGPGALSGTATLLISKPWGFQSPHPTSTSAISALRVAESLHSSRYDSGNALRLIYHDNGISLVHKNELILSHK